MKESPNQHLIEGEFGENPEAPEVSHGRAWNLLKRRLVLPGVMLLSLFSAVPTFATEGSGRGQESAAAEIGEINRLYAVDFEQDKSKSSELARKLEHINKSPEFESFEWAEQAELLHRQAFSELAFNEQWFREKAASFSEEDARGFQDNFREVTELLRRAIDLDMTHRDGALSRERERSVNALFRTAQSMAYDAIVLRVERPTLESTAKEIQEQAAEVAAAALEVAPRETAVHYGGNGFFFFSPAGKAEAMLGLVGLAKFTGDLPGDAQAEQAARSMGGAHYSTVETAAWANALHRGQIPGTAPEKALISNLIDLGILEVRDGVYRPGMITDVVFTPADPTRFTHEMAHTVYNNHPEYERRSEDAFAHLPPEDEALFRSFMRTQNPGMTQAKLLNEFFAYSHQSGSGWQAHAREVLRAKH